MMFSVKKSDKMDIELMNMYSNTIPTLRPLSKPFPRVLEGIRYIHVLPESCAPVDMSSDMSSDMSLDMSFDMSFDMSSDMSFERKGCFKRPGRSNKNRVRFNIPVERVRLKSSVSSSSFSELGDDFI